MLSLDNTYSVDELRNWERRVHELSGRKDIDYVCELKLDGMSLALLYEDGRLVRGITRGDGTRRRRCDLECADGALDSAVDFRKKSLRRRAFLRTSRYVGNC